jgi:hypothetical protein
MDQGASGSVTFSQLSQIFYMVDGVSYTQEQYQMKMLFKQMSRIEAKLDKLLAATDI